MGYELYLGEQDFSYTHLVLQLKWVYFLFSSPTKNTGWRWGRVWFSLVVKDLSDIYSALGSISSNKKGEKWTEWVCIDTWHMPAIHWVQIADRCWVLSSGNEYRVSSGPPSVLSTLWQTVTKPYWWQSCCDAEKVCVKMCLPQKQEDLSSDPQLWKSWEHRYIGNPSSGGRDRRIPGAQWLASRAESVRCRFRRDPVSKYKVKVTEQDSGHQHLTSTCMCTHILTHTLHTQNMYTHPHKP